MKAFLISATFALSLLPGPAAAQGQQINIIFTSENASCGAWMKSADNKLVRAHYEFWARGFVSGHNFANPAHQVKLGMFPASDELYKYLDRYCRDHPQNSFVDGTIQLLKTLLQPATREGKTPAKPTPIPAAK